jgi:fermentation-respiration switch protein FrsA (DUF1100 family)
MKMFPGTLKALAVIVIGCYLGYGIYYLVLQRRIMYPRAATPTWDVAASFYDLEKLWLEISGGEVEAWFLPVVNQSDEPAPALIFFHGNGELIDYWPGVFTTAQQLGVGVLLVEYPGYGRSSGTPTKSSINEAALAAYDTLVQMPGVDPERIVAYGRSLGGGPACLLVAQRDVAALILQSTFTNTSRFARLFLLPGFLVLDKFDNLAAVTSYPGPALIFHGQRDDTVPYQHALDLVAAADHGELITMDCVHNDCPPDYIEFWGLVEDFLQENGILPRE